MLPFPSALMIGAAIFYVGEPYLVAVGSMVDNVTTGQPINVPYPAGLAAGDIAFLEVSLFNALDSDSISTPAGWTLVSQDNINAASFWHAVFWKRLTGSESGTVTVTCSGTISPNDNLFGVMSIHRGALSSGTPYEGLANNTGTSSNITGSPVTTSGPDRSLLNFASCDPIGGSMLSSPAAGWTENYEFISTSGSADGAFKLYSSKKPYAGSYPGVVHPLAAGGCRWQVKSLALIPQNPGTHDPARPMSFAANITNWWDTSSGVALSGSNLVTWTDKIGGAQMTPQGGAPVDATLNGERVFDCFGANAMKAPFVSTDPTCSFTFVCTHVAEVAWGRILSISNSGFGDDGANAGAVTLIRNNLTDDVQLFRNTGATASVDVGGYGALFIATIDLDGTNTNLYINNVLVGSIASGAALNTSHIGLFYEVASSGNENAGGKAGDLIVTNRPLTAAERAELYDYLWGRFFV